MQPQASLSKLPPRVVVVSYRLGGADGVSTEAGKWVAAFRSLGCSVRTLAGDGTADTIEPGLAVGSSVSGHEPPPPDVGLLRSVLGEANLVVVENMCSLPLNPAAAGAVAKAVTGRPTLMHHHDLPWQRAAFAGHGPPPDDPAWCHVVPTRRSQAELQARGLGAVVLPNMFDPYPRWGDRQATRQALGVHEGCRLVVQPTRALARKGIPAALALAEALGATYWLVGQAEEGYGPVLRRLLSDAPVPVRWGPVAGLISPTKGIEHAYAAADIVAFPSSVEGFGNPPVEASLHLRPVAVGPYAVADELRSLGFDWLDASAPGPVSRWFDNPDISVLERNAAVARRHLNLDELPARLAAVMARVGVRAPGYPSADSTRSAELTSRPVPSSRNS